MTVGVLADYGIQKEIDNIVGSPPFTTGKQHLYQSNTTPTTSDSVGTYTESSFAGYVAVTFGTWGSSSVSAHIASVACATATFTLTSGSQNVYGAYFTDSGSANLIGACRDPNAPVGLNTTINVYQVTVTLTVKDVST